MLHNLSNKFFGNLITHIQKGIEKYCYLFDQKINTTITVGVIACILVGISSSVGTQVKSDFLKTNILEIDKKLIVDSFHQNIVIINGKKYHFILEEIK